jgi:hypothetical protein
MEPELGTFIQSFIEGDVIWRGKRPIYPFGGPYIVRAVSLDGVVPARQLSAAA